jgi:hypothetical protein
MELFADEADEKLVVVRVEAVTGEAYVVREIGLRSAPSRADA